MNGGQLRSVLRQLWQAVRPAEAGALDDAELLRRWAADRDPAAFEVLLWRHGPMVLGLCRRLLRHEQDAEDAFQSTFLALALKAGSIARGRAVGAWLYTVARRAALQLRSARPGTLDPRVLDSLAAAADGGAAALDAREALAEEVGRLPEKYRVAFVLCQLEGLSNEEAARQLGRPVGTVVSRLARARQRLRSRLERRGMAPSAALAALAERAVPAGMSAPVVADTIRAATRFAAGKAAGAVSAPVAALTQGVLRAMWMTRVKTAATVLLAAAFLTGAGGVWTYRSQAEGPPLRAQTKPVEAKPGPKVDPLQGLGPGPVLNPDRPKRAAPLGHPGQAQPPVELVAAVATLLAEAGKARSREAMLEQARDEVELLEVQVEVRRAYLEAAKVSSAAATEHLGRVARLKESAASEEELSKARIGAAQAKAQVGIREAELLEPMVRLNQAQRRLNALEHTPATPAEARKHRAERLHGLEQRLEALRKEIENVRRELQREKRGK